MRVGKKNPRKRTRKNPRDAVFLLQALGRG